jgi:hypothetical protein
MPNCFSLTKIGETEPTVLQRIDEEICAFLNEPVHPDYWCHGWYDSIGFMLAMGDSIDRIIDERIPAMQEHCKKEYIDTLTLIAMYIKEHYKSSAWAEIGRR